MMHLIDSTLPDVLLAARRPVSDAELSRLAAWSAPVTNESERSSAALTSVARAQPIYAAGWRASATFSLDAALDALDTGTEAHWVPMEHDAFSESVAALLEGAASAQDRSSPRGRVLVAPADVVETWCIEDLMDVGDKLSAVAWSLELPLRPAPQDADAPREANPSPSAQRDRVSEIPPETLAALSNERCRLRIEVVGDDASGGRSLEDTIDTLRRLRGYLLDDLGVPSRSLTFEPLDTDGLALARALWLAGALPDAAIRCSLFGIGPTHARPALELLLPPHEAPRRDAAREVLAVAGEPWPARHPLWAVERRTHGEADKAGGPATPLAPSDLRTAVRDEVDAWGIDDAAARRAVIDDLVVVMSTRLRPGEPLDGASLYALATSRHGPRMLMDGADA